MSETVVIGVRVPAELAAAVKKLAAERTLEGKPCTHNDLIRDAIKDMCASPNSPSDIDDFLKAHEDIDFDIEFDYDSIMTDAGRMRLASDINHQTEEFLDKESIWGKKIRNLFLFRNLQHVFLWPRAHHLSK